ncbi:OmpH family outer membrane protein [Henriciella mobilis]|uniref:OmpH family outer membrane protein n=1 Tax=Henriciella mobilis TaxID=2305467 RepID=A0A399RDW8_9PROT|nr:OmpH family outer membrane protein [Henriciella mobilis]RIJ15450.1 OmpH family outer membrane protein [Henriciella mobilis]RIJ18914.1 OmpH family outer membrane protein [Henriciella mobilis]RIJ28095.1 OmpH family outer membrane protein [Henriciella mobilis]
MQFLKAALASFAMLFTSAAIVAPVAQAQGANVVVIDQSRIMRESAGGKDIIAKVNQIEQNMTAELKPTGDALASEGETLEAKTANMSMEAIAADEALSQEVRDYARKAQAFNRQRQIAAAELQATERKAWSDFFTAMQGVLQEVVNEKNADVMIDRSDAIYVSESVDATNLVISKMDAKMPTVTVVRQKIQAQAPQQ